MAYSELVSVSGCQPVLGRPPLEGGHVREGRVEMEMIREDEQVTNGQWPYVVDIPHFDIEKGRQS